MESKGWFLQIGEILTYLEATPTSRNFVEGQQTLNSKHVISCDCLKKNMETVHIFSLCLQTSGLNLAPHEIQGAFRVKSNMIAIQDISCSCKAGLSKKCKHIAAVLLYCARNDVSEFKILSQTDVKCTWKIRKAPLLAQYEPIPLLNTACFREEQRYLTRHVLTTDKAKLCLQTFLQHFPNSALGLHNTGRSNQLKSSEEEKEEEEDIQVSFEIDKLEMLNRVLDEQNNFLMKYLESLEYFPLQDCCKTSYKKYIVCTETLKICFATMHDKNRWETERRFRITGSRCYAIYTYGKQKSTTCDWVKKSCKYFWPKKISGLQNVAHGIAFEGPARDAYKKERSVHVIETGLIISQNNPWLAYSPDGVIVENGMISKLLEIKCIVAGQKSTIMEAVEDLSFLEYENGYYQLKKRHQYYGQVQLGMAILNIKTTDFVLYASLDGSILTIAVTLDEVFVRDMLHTLKKNYFCHMLHNICVNTN